MPADGHRHCEEQQEQLRDYYEDQLRQQRDTHYGEAGQYQAQIDGLLQLASRQEQLVQQLRDEIKLLRNEVKLLKEQLQSGPLER